MLTQKQTDNLITAHRGVSNLLTSIDGIEREVGSKGIVAFFKANVDKSLKPPIKELVDIVHNSDDIEIADKIGNREQWEILDADVNTRISVVIRKLANEMQTK